MSDKLKTQPDLEGKRAQFTGNKPKKNPTMIIGIVVVVVALGVAGYFAVGNSGGATGDYVKTSDSVKISLASLDGGAKFFDHTVSTNTSVRFFALKSADGKYRAAMDACDTCYHARKGYRQEGDEMVCNNCGLKFHSTLINEVSGGCNPVGLPRTIEGDHLVIKSSELESRSRYF